MASPRTSHLVLWEQREEGGGGWRQEAVDDALVDETGPCLLAPTLTLTILPPLYSGVFPCFPQKKTGPYLY